MRGLSITRANPYRLGLAAIGALVLLSGLVVAVSLMSFGTNTYRVELEHTAGLRAGEDVQVAGVSSGEVTSIELDGQKVIAEFTLNDDIELGRDTRAFVRVATLLGTHYLKIDPRGSGELSDDTIPLAQSSVPFNLQDVLEVGAEKVGQLDPKLLARALSTMSDTIRAGSDELGPALQGITRVSEVVATRVIQADDLLQAAQDVADQLSDSTADIVTLMKQAQLVLDEIVRRRDALHELLVDANHLLTALNSITRTADQHVGRALKDLDVTLDVLRSHRKDLATAFRLLAPTTRYIANAAGNGPWIDVYAPSVVPDAAPIN